MQNISTASSIETDTHEALPRSVRYIKNGMGGRWWKTAKTEAQLHAGWQVVRPELLLSADEAAIASVLGASYAEGKRGLTRELNQLMALLKTPSQHIWVTFEGGFMWWCTVRNAVTVNPAMVEDRDEGYFWLSCARPWSNRSLGGRLLAEATLPGSVTTTKGFQGTVCIPSAEAKILRLIQDEEDPDAQATRDARVAYEAALLKLVQRLHWKDFELLIDLILARSGWVRIRDLGKQVEGVDIEAENPALGEVAFVQVKSRADQRTLDDYVERFADRRDRYRRMIFAVHSPTSALVAPNDADVQVWAGDRIAGLAVRHGLGGWIADRI